MLTSVIQQLSFAQKSAVPELQAALYVPEVEAKILEAPIGSDPIHESGRTVAYIDAEVRVQLATSISLDSGIPYWLAPGEKETQETRHVGQRGVRCEGDVMVQQPSGTSPVG